MVLPTQSALIHPGAGARRSDDLGHIELLRLGERPLVVGDRTGGVLDGRRGAVVALGAFTDAAIERLSGALAPGAIRCGVEVLLEIVRGSRLVTAEHDVYRQIG